jgi:hypothetical protein
VVKILLKRSLYRENLAQYADYNSDFDGRNAARAIPEQGIYALLAVAFAQPGRGQWLSTATFKRWEDRRARCVLARRAP